MFPQTFYIGYCNVNLLAIYLNFDKQNRNKTRPVVYGSRSVGGYCPAGGGGY